MRSPYADMHRDDATSLFGFQNGVYHCLHPVRESTLALDTNTGSVLSAPRPAVRLGLNRH